ncbi:MAG: hypothetical protein ACFNNB_01980 [Candidatus Saccharimonas sp.]|mgnify:FL=1|jgi:hypothetical protein
MPTPENLAYLSCLSWKLLDKVDLEENARNYKVLQRPTTRKEERALGRIEEMLLDGLPLTHSTEPESLNTIQNSAIKPAKVLPEGKLTHTLPLDESLGLDEYAFASWGDTHKHSIYGSSTLLLCTEKILLSDETIASPYDITLHIGAGTNFPYTELNKTDTEHLEAYLQTLVTGERWLEITARKALEIALKGTVPVIYHTKLNTGEIKHKGAIDSAHIQGVLLTEDDYRAAQNEMLRDGFMAGPLNSLTKLYGHIPAEYEANLKRAKKIWRKVVDLAGH